MKTLLELITKGKWDVVIIKDGWNEDAYRLQNQLSSSKEEGAANCYLMDAAPILLEFAYRVKDACLDCPEELQNLVLSAHKLIDEINNRLP